MDLATSGLEDPVGDLCDHLFEEEAERNEFCAEMGVQGFDRAPLLRQIMDASGQMLFFTAGEKEVRTWMFRKGGTAVEAADGILDLSNGSGNGERPVLSEGFIGHDSYRR